jgi:hypothetical protein
VRELERQHAPRHDLDHSVATPIVVVIGPQVRWHVDRQRIQKQPALLPSVGSRRESILGVGHHQELGERPVKACAASQVSPEQRLGRVPGKECQISVRATEVNDLDTVAVPLEAEQPHYSRHQQVLGGTPSTPRTSDGYGDNRRSVSTASSDSGRALSACMASDCCLAS